MAELKGGAKFSVIVKKYSDDPNAEQGGDIGLEKESALPSTIAAALSKIDVNENTDAIPVKKRIRDPEASGTIQPRHPRV